MSGGYESPSPRSGDNGMGTAAMVLGIIGLVLSFTVLFGFVLGVLAIIFGQIGRGRSRRGEASNGGQATAGFVLGIISVVIAIGILALVLPSGGHFCVHAGTGPSNC
jgi:hypothetical protein